MQCSANLGRQTHRGDMSWCRDELARLARVFGQRAVDLLDLLQAAEHLQSRQVVCQMGGDTLAQDSPALAGFASCAAAASVLGLSLSGLLGAFGAGGSAAGMVVMASILATCARSTILSAASGARRSCWHVGGGSCNSPNGSARCDYNCDDGTTCSKQGACRDDIPNCPSNCP